MRVRTIATESFLLVKPIPRQRTMDVCMGTGFETCFGMRTLIITCNAKICMMQAITYGGNIATPTGGPRKMEFWTVWPGPRQCLAAATSAAASQIMHPHAHPNKFHIRIFFVCSAGGSMSHNTGTMQLLQSRDKHLLGPRGAGRVDWSLDQ